MAEKPDYDPELYNKPEEMIEESTEYDFHWGLIIGFIVGVFLTLAIYWIVQ